MSTLYPTSTPPASELNTKAVKVSNNIKAQPYACEGLHDGDLDYIKNSNLLCAPKKTRRAPGISANQCTDGPFHPGTGGGVQVPSPKNQRS
ncbi:hypothetical protein MJO29_016826 [Puccinia striiformis f. sp. tritici]|nr:hypothetical protein MJO29_016826 [Puccinia striiformis f. sp. tritici]